MSDQTDRGATDRGEPAERVEQTERVQTDGGRDRRDDQREPRERRTQDDRARQGNQPQRGQQQGGQPSQGGQPRHGQQQGGQPRHGRQQGNQPRGGQQQGSQPPQGGRPRQGPGGPPSRPSQDDGISRRQMLLGGAGAAVVAGAGGWWFFLRGPSGAKGVVDDYYSALDSFDWNGFVNTHHPDSRFRESVDEEDDFENRFNENLAEELENTSFSVQGLYELDHEEDIDEDSGFPDDADIEEFKQIHVVVEEDRSDVPDLDDDEDEVTVNTNTLGVALDSNGDWGIWN